MFALHVNTLPTAGVPTREGLAVSGAGVMNVESAPAALATPVAARMRKWYVVAAVRARRCALTAWLPWVARGAGEHGACRPYAVVRP